MKKYTLAVTLALGVELATFVSAQKPYTPPRRFPMPVQFPTPIRPVEGSSRERQLHHLKALAVATIQYLQDKDNLYPDMKSSASVKKALWPFLKNDAAFTDPMTGQPYQPNPYLSHRSASTITEPSKIVLFYEARPNPDGTRAACFADGHTVPILTREWPRVKRLSHIP